MRRNFSPSAITQNMRYIGQYVTIEDVTEAIGWIMQDYKIPLYTYGKVVA